MKVRQTLHWSRRALRSAARLLVGAVAVNRSVDLRQIAALGTHGRVTLSVDLFDTLLLRGRTRDTGLMLFELVAAPHADLHRSEWKRSCFRGAARRLAAQAIEHGKDPELPRRLLFAEALTRLWQRTPTPAEVDELCDLELAFIRNTTAPCATVHRLMTEHHRHGGRVVIVSDTRLSGPDIRHLLDHHGIHDFDSVYASSDFGASKFRGTLYKRVIADEKVAPADLVHVGDDRFADAWSARRALIRSCHYAPREAAAASAIPAYAYDLGYAGLGRVFAGFAELLLDEARRRNVQQLAFLARDGHFLMEASERLARFLSDAPDLRTRYVHVSRRSALLASRDRLTAADVHEALHVRAAGGPMHRVLAYFNIDPTAVAGAVSSAGYMSINAVSKECDILRVVESPLFVQTVRAEHVRQRELLEAYLDQQAVFDLDTALVDVGWRGSIQAALHAAFPARFAKRSLHGLYVGYWSEADLRLRPDSCIGLLSDMRRRRTVTEGSAWYLAALLEAVCRADEGTTLGYSMDENGVVKPMLASSDRSRDAEQASSITARSVRQGVLDYIDHYLRYRPRGLDLQSLRADIQDRLRRLSFYPTQEEIAVGMQLMHTESHAPDWSVPLIYTDMPNPVLHPLRWMHGLRSPWRGAYVKATGGELGATAALAAEAALLLLPQGVRRTLRTGALAASSAADG